MKKIILILVASLFASNAFADGKDGSNFRFSPIGLLIGSIRVNYDIAVDSNWTVGPELEYWHFSLSEDPGFDSDFTVTAYEIGVRANWFANGKFTDGLYVGPNLGYTNVKVTTTDGLGNDVSGTASTAMLGCLVGYGWFWNSFNQMLGIGAQVGLGSTSVSVTTSGGTTTSVSSSIGGLAAEYSLGWTF